MNASTPKSLPTIQQKAIAVILVGFLALFAALAFTPRAYADTTDTGFGFYLKSKGSTDGTGWRYKDHAGSAYIHIMGHNGHHCRLYIDGAISKYGHGAKNCMIGEAWSNHDGKYRLRNTVRDKHAGDELFDYARLTAWAPYGEGSVNGVWSPDCSKEAEHLPVLNEQ